MTNKLQNNWRCEQVELLNRFLINGDRNCGRPVMLLLQLLMMMIVMMMMMMILIKLVNAMCAR